MSTAERGADTRRYADPDAEPLADCGRSAIMIPLIIGGAVVVSVIILWQTYTQKLHMGEMARTEEAARLELRSAYGALRAKEPDAALEHAAAAGRMHATLREGMSSGYAKLRIAILLFEAESLFMKDSLNNAVVAERKFADALALMPYASGDVWEFGMLGRSRMRFESGRHKDALADLDTILERNPNFGTAYYWRSLTKKALGDDAGAGADEQRARALDSWPPLRDFVPAPGGAGTRDILAKHPAADTSLGDILAPPVE